MVSAKVRDPRVYYDKSREKWRIMAKFFATKGTAATRKCSKWYGTEIEARAAIPEFIRSLDPSGSSSPATVMFATKANATQKKAYKRAKTEAGWTGMTLVNWQSHKDLK